MDGDTDASERGGALDAPSELDRAEGLVWPDGATEPHDATSTAITQAAAVRAMTPLVMGCLSSCGTCG